MCWEGERMRCRGGDARGLFELLHVGSETGI